MNAIKTNMLWFRLFLPFAGGFFLSYLYRTINAVVGPILSDELSLSAADLGLLTSTYFIAFGATQLPLGMLLDRFGARRIEVTLLLVAAAGTVVFASSHSIGSLAVGRAMIGLGVSACLMAAFKAFSQWFPPERQASVIGLIMTSGTLGAFMASAPLDAALHIATWREIFYALGGITAAVSLWIWFSVPEKPVTAHHESFSALIDGIRTTLSSGHFWRFAPLAFALIGGFLAVQSLWSGAWLIHVNGYSRSVAADHLAAMSIAMVVAYFLIGLLSTPLAKRGIGTVHLLGCGMAISLLSLLLIITQAAQTVNQHYLLWITYGAFSSAGTLAYPATAAGFSTALSGRVNTLLNLVAFLGAFCLQWGMGALIDLFLASGHTAAIAHRNVFAMLFVLQALALGWLFFSGWRAKK